MKIASVRIALVFGLACGVTFAVAGPALAKGPIQVVIEGPGLSPSITLLGDDVASLDELSGLGGGLWGCANYAGCVQLRPSGQLGPSYTATYTLPTNEKVVQYLYPDASPSPVTYVPAGQRFFGQRSKGAWFIVGPAFRQLLVDVSVIPAAVPSASPKAASSLDGERRPMGTVLALALAILVVAGVVVARLRRRLAGLRKRAAIGGSPAA